jgi:signal recognition particle subunit SRP54
MLDKLGDGFKQARNIFSGHTKLTEANISDAVGIIRTSLLEADVEYGVAKSFIKRIQEKAIGQSVTLKAGKGSGKVRVRPADHFIKICQEELESLMGPADAALNFAKNKPTVILMAGLQGSGKTTTTAKLTRYLCEKFNKKPLLVGVDIYRPAAIEQLKVLAERLNVPVHASADQPPAQTAKESLKKAFDLGCDTIIIDTAGRLTVDETLMTELEQIKDATSPDNILFVCDSMMGQDAVTTAKAFNERLDISGIIMTKLDGDARGGAALSIKQVTGTPIKFLGMGEGLEALEEFRPEGLASRILGMGDIVGLMDDFQKVSTEDTEQDAMRMLSGQFTFRDFYQQIETIQKMGSLKDLMGKIPMGGGLPKDLNVDENELVKIKAMIDSMTESERIRPTLFNASRIKRVSLGSGRSQKEVNALIAKFKQMRQMMGSLGKNLGMLGKIPGMKGLSQMSNMKQMMSGMGGMPGMPGMMGGASSLGTAPRKVDREKLKKARKDAKKSRKKNRRK